MHYSTVSFHTSKRPFVDVYTLIIAEYFRLVVLIIREYFRLEGELWQYNRVPQGDPQVFTHISLSLH